MRKFLVIYQYKFTEVGSSCVTDNTEIEFVGPVTLKMIRNLEKELKEKYGYACLVIINLIHLEA